jgi:hypothetical protein
MPTATTTAAGDSKILFRRSGTLSIPICLETVTLALPFLGEINLIARIRLDVFIRILCQRRPWDGGQEGKEDNESEYAHLCRASQPTWARLPAPHAVCPGLFVHC